MTSTGTTYGVDAYGTSTYGATAQPPFRVDPFTAESISEDSILIRWAKPTGTILAYRLVKNMSGPPTDQDDGQVLIDTTSGYPGSQFIDTSIIPGKFHYYGFFLLVNFTGNVWIKSATTATLAITEFESHQWIKTLIPSYFLRQSDSVSLTGVALPAPSQDIPGVPDADDVPDTFLDKFVQVLGWGLDYLRTQYSTYLNTNNAWTIPIADLHNLAEQLGLNVNPDIHPYTLRKAIFNNAVVNKQRGTIQGIDVELSSLTGYNADIQIGRNFMLENDQSAFIDPAYVPWSPNINYNLNEKVTFGNFKYTCILATGNIGNAPTGTSSSNTWWQAVLGFNDNAVLLNSRTGNPNTWDILYPSQVNGAASANSIFETLGVTDPLNSSVFSFNSLQGINLSGSTGTIWLRSIARTPVDLTIVTTNFAPNKDQVTGDGIPVPFVMPSQIWNPVIRYGTNQIVTYANQPFIALRASANIIPPYSSIGTTNAEWAPVSFDQRLRICISAYVTGSAAVPATAFAEWYDASGNFITRVFSRNSPLPTQFCYDSFVAGAGTFLGGRTTDDGSTQWSAGSGSYVISSFGNGCVYPSAQGQRSYNTLSVGSPNVQVAVTFVTNPQAGQSQGLILRKSNDSNYFRADQTTLKVKQSGVFSTLGTYSTPFSAGDRMIAQCNGSTITILRNNVQVLQVTSTFNQTINSFGIINENT